MLNAAVLSAALKAALVTALTPPTSPAPIGTPVICAQGSPAFTFSATGNTITRSGGSWTSDGFAVGYTARIVGTSSNDALNCGPVTALTATVMTLASPLVNEGPVAGVLVAGGPPSPALTPLELAAQQMAVVPLATAIATAVASSVVAHIQANAVASITISTSEGGLQTSTSSGSLTNPPSSPATITGTVQ